ncbi:MAG TPA: hypothetical protein VGI67_18445 [Thermoleophilaceae bacterium]|jgi:hypothetical protein
MEEIAPGIFHWTAFHDGIGMDVHSYYVPEAVTLIDPMEPDEGLDWFAEHGPPERILLSNRHHYRHSGRFVDRYGCRVLCHKSGLHEFEGGAAVQGFEFGREVAPGITAYEVDSLCPEESALHIEVGAGALSVADGVVQWPGRKGLAFVPDNLMGDDPDDVKDGLRAAYARLADELAFDTLLMAHGSPVVGDGRQQLRAFAADAT